MKKIIIIIACLLFYKGSLLFANNTENQIDFEIQIIDDTPTYPGNSKSPMRTPSVYLNNHVLSFCQIFSDVIPVELINEEDNIVYTTWLMPGETTINLPSSFTGHFTLRLTIGAFYFLGDITL